MQHPETVRIVDQTGTNPFIVINKDDLTEEMELFDKPSGYLKVADIKAALTEKGVEIPAGANRAELLALLNG